MNIDGCGGEDEIMSNTYVPSGVRVHPRCRRRNTRREMSVSYYKDEAADWSWRLCNLWRGLSAMPHWLKLSWHKMCPERTLEDKLSTRCARCEEDFFLSGQGECEQCDSSWRTCSGHREDQCDSCWEVPLWTSPADHVKSVTTHVRNAQEAAVSVSTVEMDTFCWESCSTSSV